MAGELHSNGQLIRLQRSMILDLTGLSQMFLVDLPSQLQSLLSGRPILSTGLSETLI